MNDTILTSAGLDKILAGERLRLQQFLAKRTRPRYMNGVFIGMWASEADFFLLTFIDQIRTNDRKVRCLKLMENRIIPHANGYLFQAAVIDDVLDAAAGFR